MAWDGNIENVFCFMYNDVDEVSVMEYTVCDKKLIVGSGTVEICYADVLNIFVDEDLEEIQLPPTVRVIHDNTFFDFPSVKRINIPNGVRYIGERSFWGLDDLKEVTLPISVPFIGKHAFCNCTKLILTIVGNSSDVPSGWDKEFAANIKEIRFQNK